MIAHKNGSQVLGTPAETTSLNILVLNDTCELDGGSARIALEDARKMAKRGHRVIFFSACGRPPLESDGIEWHSLEQRTILDEPNRLLAILRGLWNPAASRALKKILLTLPPDSTVVHLHSWSKALSGSVVAMTRNQGYRLICTLHDYFLVCPNGTLYDHPMREVCMLTPMSAKCVMRNCDSRARVHKIWRVVRQWVWRYVAGIPGRFNTIIAVSDFSAKKLAEYLSSPVPIEVIDNLPSLQRSGLQPLVQRHSIIYAGRVAAEKGPDLYLEACRIANAPAEVWGDGPLLPSLKAAWPTARFAGWAQSVQLQARLAEALALVVPSLCYETYGLVTAEAAAAGVAVVVSDHGAAATLVEDGVTGVHFRAGDSVDLADKIARFQKDPELAYSMGKVAYDRFWHDYDVRSERRIEQIEACYRKVLEMPA